MASKLDEIYLYSILHFGLDRADAYLVSLHESFQLLAENPRMGRQFRSRRRHEHQEHAIFYRILGHGIVVTQIFHHSENILARLR